MPLRCATMSGVTLLINGVVDALQDAQDLGTVAALAQQGDGKVKGHGCARIVGCGWWASFRAHPLPLYQAAISRSSSQRAALRTSS